MKLLLLLGTLVLALPVYVCGAGCIESALDVAFLIDKSYSIPKQDFKQVTKFAETLVGKLAKNADVHVGLIEFAGKAVASMWLNDPANKKGTSAVQKKIRGITQTDTSLGTETHLAFYIVRTQMLNANYDEGTRCGAQRIVVLITDGAPSVPNDAWKEATATREQDIMVFVVGTGSDANFGSATSGSRALLAAYYTGDDIDKVFRAENYAELDNMAEKMIGPICKAANAQQKAVKLAELSRVQYDKKPNKAG